MSAIHSVPPLAVREPIYKLSDFSERELLVELTRIEERIREHLPADETWPHDPTCDPELLALFLRERAVSRQLHAERAVPTAVSWW